jgi:hypothetical protein
MIHLIFKDLGLDPLEAASYRPISLTSCISKMYQRVILNRLSEAFERDGILLEEQAGFRQHRCTLEQAYILREAVDSRKHRHATFMCFVDFTNAFPSTWQDGMWSRLRETGVKGRLYRSIRSLYKLCKSSIQTPYGLTDWFMSDLGTRQGAVLSFLLFSLVVNPLATLLKSKGFGVKMGGIQLACLLYVDDLVLIADSEEQLQGMMNTTTEFLQQWRFVVSARKTQVVALLKTLSGRLATRRSMTSEAINISALFSKRGASGTKCKIRTWTKPKRNTNAYIMLDLVTPVSKSANLHFSGSCSQNPKCCMGQKCGPATPKQHYSTSKNSKSKVHEKYSASGPCQQSLAKLV